MLGRFANGMYVEPKQDEGFDTGHAGSITDAYRTGTVEPLSKRTYRWDEFMEAAADYASERPSRSRHHKVVSKPSSSRVIADSSSPARPQ